MDIVSMSSISVSNLTNIDMTDGNKLLTFIMD